MSEHHAAPAEEPSGERRPYGVTVTLQPSNKTEVLPVRSVLQLLNKLQIRPTTVLVIRDGGLLTPDQRLNHGDEIIVRTVVSSG